jgi:hypothetical protein
MLQAFSEAVVRLEQHGKCEQVPIQHRLLKITESASRRTEFRRCPLLAQADAVLGFLNVGFCEELK